MWKLPGLFSRRLCHFMFPFARYEGDSSHGLSLHSQNGQAWFRRSSGLVETAFRHMPCRALCPGHRCCCAGVTAVGCGDRRQASSCRQCGLVCGSGALGKKRVFLSARVGTQSPSLSSVRWRVDVSRPFPRAEGGDDRLRSPCYVQLKFRLTGFLFHFWYEHLRLRFLMSEIPLSVLTA